MYIPDWSIVKRVKAIDPALEISWMPSRERGCLYRHDRGRQRVLLHVVQNGDGSYRPLDGRLLSEIRAADTRRRRLRDYMQSIEDHNARLVERRRREFANDVEAISSEVYPQVRKEAEATSGAMNIRKEDVRAELKRTLRPVTQDVLGL